MIERIICEFCGSSISRKDRKQHYRTKKCIKSRTKKRCPGCNQELSDSEYEGHIKTCFSYNQFIMLKNENDKLKEQLINLKEEKDKKDEFIQSMASRPTVTTNNNHFNINQYFEGNRGLDFLDNQQLMDERIEHCRLMMEDTIENHGLNPKMIEETKKEQCEYLFKDETTGKWNVINTDTARNTFSICKRADDGKTIYVKDPKGKMLKLTVDRVDKDNKRMIYKISLEQDNMTLEEKFINLDACIAIGNERLLTNVPVKSMI